MRVSTALALLPLLGVAIVGCSEADEDGAAGATAATTSAGGAATSATGAGGAGEGGGGGATTGSGGEAGGPAACVPATEDNTGPMSPCTTTHQGDLEVTEPDTVIDGYCIEGGSIVLGPDAKNVVVRNTEIRSLGFAGGFYSGSGDLGGLLVEDTHIDCQLGGGSSGIGGSNWTGHRVEIRNCENGIDIGSNVVLTNSLIHMPNNEGEAHADGIQIYEASHDDLIDCNVIHSPNR